MTIPQAFDLALQHHQAGRLAEAGAIYRQILAVEPRHADSLHLLGVIAHQSGHSDAAVDLIRQAIALAPDVAEFHSNIGEAHRALGRSHEATEAFRTALKLKPQYAEAHNNLGNALSEQGRLAEAIAAYRAALELKPQYAEAHSNLGSALKKEGRLDEAVAAIRRALTLRPDYAGALNNLGAAQREQGRLDEAVAACRRAIQIRPEFVDAHVNLGNALMEQGQLDEAIAVCIRAIQIRPEFVEAHISLGNALMAQGRFDEAITAYQKALALNPKLPEAHSNLGAVLQVVGFSEQAIVAYFRALECKPDFVRAHSNLLLSLHYPAGLDPVAIFQEHRRWDETHARPLARFIKPHANESAPERRLRIGYVSPDFREHSVALFMDHLLAGHDPAQVEVYYYAELLRADPATERLKRNVGSWRKTTGMGDAEVAELIREDGIDILVDLAGHTGYSRLSVFARKPAPVQVTYLGYCDTTGLSAMDWRLTDAHADPPGMTEQLHSEELVRLPGCAWCFRPSDAAPPVDPPPVLQTGHITFGCFNILPKITGEILALWSRILQQAPGSRLLLKNYSFRSPSVRERTSDLLEKAGIAPHRVELVGAVPTLAEHLALYGRVDMALDTFPYHGTTTTCEALWMGVPVVTLAGKTHASRVGVSLLSNVGLPELVAQSPEEYVRIAVELGKDVDRLGKMRGAVRGQMAASPLMDGPRFARNVEQAYRRMWREWCAKQTSLQTP